MGAKDVSENQRERLEILGILYTIAHEKGDYGVQVPIQELADRVERSKARVDFLLEYFAEMDLMTFYMGDTVSLNPQGAVYYEKEVIGWKTELWNIVKESTPTVFGTVVGTVLGAALTIATQRLF